MGNIGSCGWGKMTRGDVVWYRFTMSLAFSTKVYANVWYLQSPLWPLVGIVARGDLLCGRGGVDFSNF